MVPLDPIWRNDELVSVADVGALLRVSPPEVDLLIREGLLTVIRLSGLEMFRLSEVQELALLGLPGRRWQRTRTPGTSRG